MNRPTPALYTVVSRSFAALPRAVLQVTARTLGFVLFNVLQVRRRVVLDNLSIALAASAPATRARVGRAAMHSFLLTFFESLAAGSRDLASTVEVQGREHLEAARAQGKGVLILCIHMGNWEALAAAVSRQVAPTHVVVKRVGKGAFDRFVAWSRARAGYDAIRNDGSGSTARAIFRALRANEIVGFVMDQYQPGAPYVPCFGVPTRTNTGLATIWRRTDAPVVPVTTRRVGVHRHVAQVWPALTLPRTDDAAADVLEATRRFNQVMEKMILENPEQYFWMHDRWKRRRAARSGSARGLGLVQLG